MGIVDGPLGRKTENRPAGEQDRAPHPGPFRRLQERDGPAEVDAPEAGDIVPFTAPIPPRRMLQGAMH